MYVRRVKRKCGVRGCKNTNSFAISLTREPGNSIIICQDCLREGAKAVGTMKPNQKKNFSTSEEAKIPALFFGSNENDGLKADIATFDETPNLNDNEQNEGSGSAPVDDETTPDKGQGETTPPADNGDQEPKQPDGVDLVGDNSDVEDGTTPPDDDTSDEEVTPVADDVDNIETTPPADVTEFKCPICGRTFDNERGLKTHMRQCKQQNVED